MNARLEQVGLFETFLTRLIIAFAAMSLLIATLGHYAVAAFNSTRRSREFGVRMALGASTAEVRWFVLREAWRLVAPALLIGFAVSAAVAGLFRSVLLDVSPLDPFTYALVTLLLVLASLAASYFLPGAPGESTSLTPFGRNSALAEEQPCVDRDGFERSGVRTNSPMRSIRIWPCRRVTTSPDGMTPDEARAAAMREFGNVPLVRADDARGVVVDVGSSNCCRTCASASRILCHAPGLSATAIVLIALVIGGNTTIYSMVNSLIISPGAWRHRRTARRDPARRTRRDHERSIHQLSQLRGLRARHDERGPACLAGAASASSSVPAAATTPSSGRWSPRDYFDRRHRGHARPRIAARTTSIERGRGRRHQPSCSGRNGSRSPRMSSAVRW